MVAPAQPQGICCDRVSPQREPERTDERFRLRLSRGSPRQGAGRRARVAELPGPACRRRRYAIEALNFVDGARSVQAIRDALTAEFGPVPLEPWPSIWPHWKKSACCTGRLASSARVQRTSAATSPPSIDVESANRHARTLGHDGEWPCDSATDGSGLKSKNEIENEIEACIFREARVAREGLRVGRLGHEFVADRLHKSSSSRAVRVCSRRPGIRRNADRRMHIPADRETISGTTRDDKFSQRRDGGTSHESHGTNPVRRASGARDRPDSDDGGCSRQTRIPCRCARDHQGQGVCRPHAQLQSDDTRLGRLRAGDHVGRRRSKVTSALHDRKGRVPVDHLFHGRPVRHAHRPASTLQFRTG